MIHINPYSWTDDQPLILAICPSLDHGTCAGSYWLSRNHANFEKPDAGRRVARCGGPHSHILQCCLNMATLCYPLFLFGFSLRYCTWMQIRSWSPFSQFFEHCNTHPYPTSSKSYRHMSGYARHVYINVSSMISPCSRKPSALRDAQQVLRWLGLKGEGMTWKKSLG